ncbi:hypothetical protein [Geomonas sp. Red32]|uniref:hypothetical protein n=1 Tax=Geomonas sp. Red32 TaxID=2912856 RepID=UPI00202CEAED|nr:hypothetical protein [Geomonas sp. Red32]
MKGLHSAAVCGWIGGGLSILILLKLAGSSSWADEAFTIKRLIEVLDDYLITPSAGITTVTGLLLGAAKPWGLKRRWITEKCAVTTILLVFGTLWLAPGLQNMHVDSRWDSGPFLLSATLRWGAAAATLQTAALLLLVALSILKPEK